MAPVREKALKDGFLCGDRVTTASSMRRAAGWCVSTNSLRSPWDVGMSVLWKISSMPLSLMVESGKLCIQRPVILGVCMCMCVWGGGWQATPSELQDRASANWYPPPSAHP